MPAPCQDIERAPPARQSPSTAMSSGSSPRCSPIRTIAAAPADQDNSRLGTDDVGVHDVAPTVEDNETYAAAAAAAAKSPLPTSSHLTRPSPKSAHLSFLHNEDLEDEFASMFDRRYIRRTWLQFLLGFPMTVLTAKRKTTYSVRDDEVRYGLLADPKHPKKWKRRSTCYNYFMFCSLSGFSVLAILLVVNLSLIIATYNWTRDFDPALQNWGSPGTGTEDLAWYPTDFTRDVVPIPCHSHNDYWRRVPLFSAIRAGCTGVEADVWLFDSELFVGHNTASLTNNRTFENLYVKPLVRILEDQNPESGIGKGVKSMNGVFDTVPEQSLILLIDVKTGGAETWPWVLKQLDPLRERGWLSFVEDNKLHERPITVVGTGNCPFDVLTQNTTYRDAFFDAPLEMMWEPTKSIDSSNRSTLSSPSSANEAAESFEDTLGAKTIFDAGQGMSGVTANSTFTPLNSYYASVSFVKSVGRMWRSTLTPKQMETIRGQVRGAHRRGLKVRYWDFPSWPLGLRNYLWEVLIREGVDVLNVDDLRAVSKGLW